MVSHAINAHIKQSQAIIEFVWFNGDGALNEGQGVCYNWDYGTAANYDARRTNEVEVPTILNAPYFAGVAARPYAAHTGGQFIEIFLPGSTCNVWSELSNTIGVGRTTCEAGAGGGGAGFFGAGGLPGRGSATPLQTIDRSTTAGLCMVYLETGPESGLVEYITPAAAGGAITCMVGGVTRFLAVTLAADATFTLADGTLPGQRKAFHVEGLQTTNNIVITVTSGEQLDGATDLATITMDAVAMTSVLEWCGFATTATWRLMHNIASVLA